MKLSKSETNDLFEALQDGYRSYNDLIIMVRLNLNQNLEKIVSPGDMRIVIMKLIDWAESRDKLLDLVWGANNRNPDNLQIRNITYKLFYITQTQWEKFYKLLSQIHPTYLYLAIQESFQPKEIVKVDPRLIKLQSLDAEKIQDILKDNLIKKREQSSQEIPVILKFVYYLSIMPYEEINRALQANLSSSNSPPPKYTICNEFKTWVAEVSNQLNIQLETQEEKKSLSNWEKSVSKLISRRQEKNTPSKTQEKKKSLSNPVVPKEKMNIQLTVIILVIVAIPGLIWIYLKLDLIGNYNQLRKYLKTEDWQKANQETIDIMLKVTKRDSKDGLDDNAIKNFPCKDLVHLNQLWQDYSHEKFGFRAQKSKYEETGNIIGRYNENTFNKFVENAGWRLKGLWISDFQLDFSNEALPGHLPSSRILIDTLQKGELFSRMNDCSPNI